MQVALITSAFGALGGTLSLIYSQRGERARARAEENTTRLTAADQQITHWRELWEAVRLEADDARKARDEARRDLAECHEQLNQRPTPRRRKSPGAS